MHTNRNTRSGLTDAEVLASRERHGANVLTPPERETMWGRLLNACRDGIVLGMFALFALSLAAALFLMPTLGVQAWVMPMVAFAASLLIMIVGFFGGLNDPLFKILVTAFVLSLGIATYEYLHAGADETTFFEPLGIIVALLLATGVAFSLERSNEKTFQSLNEVNDDTLVKVIRNSNVCQVPRRDIVVGDIVLLETGEEVPADCELLESLGLSVNESSLTGELHAAKTTDPAHFDPDATYPSNHVMKGTTVIEGYCTAKVIAVGDATASGKVFEAAQVEEGEQTPLSRKLDAMAKWIAKASYAVAALIVVGRIIVYFAQGNADFGCEAGVLDFVSYLLNTVMIAVTLIVVAVPEGLPMSVTLSLAFSMRKLMKEKTLPRTMHACETMGATSVICTDKTGTLTQNQMQVAEAHISETNEALVAELIAANSTAQLDLSDAGAPKPIGNPTEGALLLWLNANGKDYKAVRDDVSIVDRLPFCTENKYMATVVDSPALGRKALFVKGAPEFLLAFCNVSDDEKRTVEQQWLAYQSKAMRTLAVAYKPLDADCVPFADGKIAETGLTFAGFFAISDPVRAEVPGAIRDCVNAGIKVKIVTGDTPGTAKEIGRQIGLWSDSDTERNIMTGTEFAALSDSELRERVPDLKILSRARPNDKERLVRTLRGLDYVVAVTGDGTNDAPALNAANVGLSMGDGTAVAKEASDMTIMDNSFSTITNAVMWGRSLYKNIQRFILFQTTINVVACLIVLVGAFLGTESPITVTQMLWVNLIMDTFAAIALASLPPSRSVMKDKPRSNAESIISRAMGFKIFGVGALFFLVLLAMLVVMEKTEVNSFLELFTLDWHEHNGLSIKEQSIFFTTFVMLQFWNMFNAKAFMTGKSAFSGFENCRGFVMIAIVILIGQFLIVTFGGRMFNVEALCGMDWLMIIGSTFVVVAIISLIVNLFSKRFAVVEKA